MNIKKQFLKNRNAQIFIFEVFIVLLIIILIIFLSLNVFSKYNLKYKYKNKDLKILEQILLVDNIIKDSANLALKKNRCYSNEIDISKINNILKFKNINNIKINSNLVYLNSNTQSLTCYNRGIIENNIFKVIEVCFSE